MRPFSTISLLYTYLRISAIALGANPSTRVPAQLPDLALSLNLTSLYDNETSLASPSSNLTSLYNNLTSSASPSSNTSLLPNNAASLTDAALPTDPTFEFYAYATISYFGYGPRLDMAGAESVFRAASSDCHRHNYQTRMGTNTRIYTEGSVELMFKPTAGTYWATWVLVQEKVLDFAIEYGYPQFGFTISHPGNPLGRGSLRAIQSIQPNELPPSPFFMWFSNLAGVVKFSNNGTAIDMSSTLRLITEATVDCSNHPDNAIIDAGALIYFAGSLTLTLGPRPRMTWGEWKEVLSLIKRFLDAYEYVSLVFDVYNERGMVGNGDLKS